RTGQRRRPRGVIEGGRLFAPRWLGDMGDRVVRTSGYCGKGLGMGMDPKALSWEGAVVWLRNQPDRSQLVLDAFYDDPLIAAAERYYASGEWQAISQLLRGQTGKAL